MNNEAVSFHPLIPTNPNYVNPQDTFVVSAIKKSGINSVVVPENIVYSADRGSTATLRGDNNLVFRTSRSDLDILFRCCNTSGPMSYYINHQVPIGAWVREVDFLLFDNETV